ncbi:MAG: YcgL domain-containing protein [Pseudomonadales bacterium]|nr:YcgL domain-containing protein [Pseudomonadales bacterium]
MEVHVYRSRRRMDTYLLVPALEQLARVPEALLGHFGEPELSFTFTLTAERSLQRIDGAELLARLAEQGFYLQLPPPREVGS